MPALQPDVLRERCLEAIVEDGERFGAVAQQLAGGHSPVQGGLDAVVPWIPAWTARDLVGHLGTVHRWATTIVRAGHTRPPPPEARQQPPTEDLLGWYALGLTELVATLRTTPPDAPAWHMSPTAGHVAADWVRRQAHELTVHRMDIEAAGGIARAPVDPELAEDGVDELLTVMLPRWAHTAPFTEARARVAVSSTDTARSWLVELTPGAVVVTRWSADADAQLQGTAVALLLRLWGRPAEVTVLGDPAVEVLLRGR